MKKFLSLLILLSLGFSSLCFATNFVWNPVGGSTSSSTAGNWKYGTTACGNTVSTTLPTSSDTITFSGSCSNGACHINANLSVKMIIMKSNYSGTVSIDAGITFTFQTSSFKGGTFTASNAALTCSYDLLIDGTAFTSTSGDFTVKGNFSIQSGSFTHNSGKVIFQHGTRTSTRIITANSNSTTISFYKVEFSDPDSNTQYSIRNMVFEVNNELKIGGGHQIFLNTNTSSTIKAKGDIGSTNSSTVGGGDITIEVNGTGNQTINDSYGTDASGKLPNMKINKSTGTLTLQGNIVLGGSDIWDYVSGTIDEGTAKLICSYNNVLKNNSGGTMKFYDLEIVGAGGCDSIKGTIQVLRNFTTSSTGNCKISSTNGGSGLLEIQGDLTWNNTATSTFGNIPFKLTGSHAQTFSGSIEPTFYNLEINKSGEQLTLQQALTISNNLNLVAKNIFTTDANLLTLKNGATVSNASASSFVTGSIKKIGNSSFTFPLGAGSSYKPLAITAPSSATDAFMAEYIGTMQPYSFHRSGLTYVSLCEYWNITRITGSSNVKITLSWDSHSCDIYSLSTLKIGRWDVAGQIPGWIDAGSVTTTGNTTSGTIQTSSDQSLFGYYLLAKNSPAISVNAGSDAAISLGQSTGLGGSPTASSGTSPYTYQWASAYALSSATTANPTATPAETHTYYVVVTDLDKMVAMDSVLITVNSFDLDTSDRFVLLAGDSIKISDEFEIDAAVGSDVYVSDVVSPIDSVFIGTSSVTNALADLGTAITKIDRMSATSLSSNLSGQTITSGVYRIAHNATLNGTVTLSGTQSSIFVIDIDSSLQISDGSQIILDGIDWSQVYWNIDGSLSESGSAELYGNFLVRDGIDMETVSGSVTLRTLRFIMITMPWDGAAKHPITANLLDPRACENFFGYNGENVVKNGIGYGTGQEPGYLDQGPTTEMPKLHPDLIRYPGGSISNWWNWKTGWFRGYTNPLYSSNYDPYLESFGGGYARPFLDDFPMPSHCHDGLPWDNNAASPLPDRMEDLKSLTDGTAAFPIFSLNLISSDIGSQVASLFHAHCINLPLKYVELGNEFYLEGEEEKELYPTSSDYMTDVNDVWAPLIKSYFPNVKIAAIASTTKDTDPEDGRRNTWNDAIDDVSGSNITNIDALTFHIYPKLAIDHEDFEEDYLSANSEGTIQNDLMPKIFSTPFEVLKYLNSSVSPQTQFQLLDAYDKEGWITEYNNEDDWLDGFAGTFAHSIYDALLTLAFLENGHITHVTSHTMLAQEEKGGLFEDDDFGIKYAMAATGLGLRYIGLASKNARSARMINFDYDGFNVGDDGENYPAVYGWMFSSAPSTQNNYSPTDSNIAVIINTSKYPKKIPVDVLFLFGGSYWQITQDDDNSSFIPIAEIKGYPDEYFEDPNVPLPTGPGAKITLEPFSITLIRNFIPWPHTTQVQVEASNSSVCPGDEVTVYLSGGVNYYITSSPVSNPIIHDDKPTVYFTDNPSTTGTYTYTITAWAPFTTFTPIELEIEVGALPTYTLTYTSSPVCEGDELNITASGYPNGTLFNWYPSVNMLDPNGDPTSEGDDIDLTPYLGQDYSVTATDGLCYCDETPLDFVINANADAGDDVWVCSDGADNLVELGSAKTYEANATFSWTVDDAYIDPADEQQTIFTPSVAGDFTYTLIVTGTGCTSTSTVTVHVLDCCEGTGPTDRNFVPYMTDYTQGNYLTSWDFYKILDNAGVSIDATDPLTYDLTNTITLNGCSDYIYINGPFEINTNLIIEDCPYIKFGPYAKISIAPNCKFSQLGSTALAAGCSGMWTGIEIFGNLQQDGGLDIEPTSNPSISDAILAINSTKDSRLGIDNCKFQDNYDNISLSDYRFGFYGSIENNTFNSTAPTFLDPYSGSTLSDFILSFDDVPYTGNGNSSLIQDNDMHYAVTGVIANETGLNFSNNIIDNVNDGIKITSPGILTNIIQQNSITTNSLSVYSSGSGISVVESGNPIVNLTIGGSPSTLGNEIYSNSAYGIKLYGFHGGLIQNNIIHLDYQSPGANIVYGILGENISSDTDYPTMIWTNTINAVGGIPVLTNKRGITLKNVINGEVKCNYITNVDYGLQLTGNIALGTLAGKFLVEGNEFQGTGYGSGYSLGYGIVLGDGTPGSNFDNFGNSSLSTGNNFYPSFANNYALYTLEDIGVVINYFRYNNENNRPETSGADDPGFEVAWGNMTTTNEFSSCSDYDKQNNQSSNPENTAFNFIVSPNPTADDASVTFSTLNKELRYDLTVRDITGKMLSRIQLSSDQNLISIPFKNYPSGIYLISITENQRIIWSSKLLKIE